MGNDEGEGLTRPRKGPGSTGAEREGKVGTGWRRPMARGPIYESGEKIAVPEQPGARGVICSPSTFREDGAAGKRA